MPRGILALNRLPHHVLTSDVIHIHWVNDLIDHILWPQSTVSRRLKLLLLYVDIVLLRLRGIAVVWTIHNLVSHESSNIPVETKARRVIARACTHALLHSQSALKRVEREYGYEFGEKASITPIGNYDGCYQGNEDLVKIFKDKYVLLDQHICILFFGAVRKYKGVQQLVEAFHASHSPSLRLIIAGKPNTPALKRMLDEVSAIDPRVIVIPEFVPDEMVAPMFAVADVVAIPFERTLTSGSTVLAMTMGKATVLPVDAKVFDLVDERSALFFRSMPELTHIFETLDKEDLIQRGLEARLQADRLNWSGIGGQVYRAYEKALRSRSGA
jgi:glycosyltransferase involved in cell wall biosynthesis